MIENFSWMLYNLKKEKNILDTLDILIDSIKDISVIYNTILIADIVYR